MDHEFAVDYELKKDSTLICGIQIKPQSYTWNASYIQKARNANIRKNDEYFKKFGVRVIDIIADTKGNIKNTDCVEIIKRYLSK